MNVAVLDYGVGNLHTLASALRAAGATVHIEANLDTALQSAAIVLPAGGAFGPAAARLAPCGEALLSALEAGRPCLAIGVGMHLLFPGSDNGEGRGLAFFSGRLQRLQGRRVPHVGWNDVQVTRSDPLLAQGTFTAWFAHVAAAEPMDDAHVVAGTSLDGNPLAAVVRRHNTWGVQFQPEKSGTAGLRLLEGFTRAAHAV
jgi:glutamine amidotransferase